MAKMDIRTFRAPINTSAPSAIFLTGLSKRRSTVRPSSRSFLQTSLGCAIAQPIRLRSYRVTAVKSCFLAQGGPRYPCQLVRQRYNHSVTVYAALDHGLQPSPERRVTR
jgi:hypothetical protein